MHGASRFQSSRLRGYGDGLPTTTDPTILAQLTQMSAQAAAPATKKKGVSLTSEQGSEIISGIGGVLDTFITTIGGIETARITGKAPTTSGTLLPSPGRGTISGGGGGGGGGSGISGTALAVGGLVVVGLGVGAYFVFRRK